MPVCTNKILQSALSCLVLCPDQRYRQLPPTFPPGDQHKSVQTASKSELVNKGGHVSWSDQSCIGGIMLCFLLLILFYFECSARTQHFLCPSKLWKLSHSLLCGGNIGVGICDGNIMSLPLLISEFVILCASKDNFYSIRSYAFPSNLPRTAVSPKLRGFTCFSISEFPGEGWQRSGLAV